MFEDSILGKPAEYTGRYDPRLLFPIARAEAREGLGIHEPLPFFGQDIWNAFELSWLDKSGRPRAGLAEIVVRADSSHIIESKSFKLYLNSFNQTRVGDSERLRQMLVQDLSEACGAPVNVTILPATANHAFPIDLFNGEVIDDLEIDINYYGPPEPLYLSVSGDNQISESLVSHVFRSNCPVTNQPDWASIQIRYLGRRIEREGLLRYLVSYRTHNGFHENCIEHIFMDLMRQCRPMQLSVYGRFTRRGGLDINPYRCTEGMGMPGNIRLIRQ
ncbi:NADPH-dependent 7-cyano-7-deazaguanine reductase QueF [Arenimonas sp. GDDSR-1]|uniref:NADPH-dependent 7-cyano-7-deazaguanine reductase QueF n=1 Tax=Arenimonas sp. GDDSR-1 TaxID=2950125 RepID=UPI002610E8CB|nr:NADPH-dependent 7-cyano-7-deazaguanine reductase QueF [Arenimonas sp. GDDSR-1]